MMPSVGCPGEILGINSEIVVGCSSDTDAPVIDVTQIKDIDV